MMHGTVIVGFLSNNTFTKCATIWITWHGINSNENIFSFRLPCKFKSNLFCIILIHAYVEFTGCAIFKRFYRIFADDRVENLAWRPVTIKKKLLNLNKNFPRSWNSSICILKTCCTPVKSWPQFMLQSRCPRFVWVCLWPQFSLL